MFRDREEEEKKKEKNNNNNIQSQPAFRVPAYVFLFLRDNFNILRQYKTPMI